MPSVLEGAVARDLRGVVLAIVEEALLPANVTDRGVGDDQAGQSSRRARRRLRVDAHATQPPRGLRPGQC